MGGKRCRISDFVVWVVSVVLGPTFTNDRAGAKKVPKERSLVAILKKKSERT